MTATVVLSPVLDILGAESLRTQLLEMRGQAVAIDASAVERLGGLCLQVLLSAQQTWAGDGQSMTFAAVSDAFSDQWTAFGALETGLELQGDPA